MGTIEDVAKAMVVGSEVRKSIKELKSKPNEKTNQKIKCPNCKKAFLEENTHYERKIFSKPSKVITFYCPLCGFKKENRFPVEIDFWTGKIIKE